MENVSRADICDWSAVHSAHAAIDPNFWTIATGTGGSASAVAGELLMRQGQVPITRYRLRQRELPGTSAAHRINSIHPCGSLIRVLA